MNRINQLFSIKQKDILSIYFCAGFPTLEGTASTIKVLEKKGVNMIEIGIPFSDPMADGPVIQHAATRALKNGMTLKLLFDQLKDIRKEVQIPLVLMGYLQSHHAIWIQGFLPHLPGDGNRRGDYPRLAFQRLYGGISFHSRGTGCENHHAHHSGNQRRTYPPD